MPCGCGGAKDCGCEDARATRRLSSLRQRAFLKADPLSRQGSLVDSREFRLLSLGCREAEEFSYRGLMALQWGM